MARGWVLGKNSVWAWVYLLHSPALLHSGPVTNGEGKGGGESSKLPLPAIVQLHDNLNLVGIALLNALNLYYLATGQHFLVFFYGTLLYFVLDLAFVAVYPLSVKSPAVILLHHAITSLYLLVPYLRPQYNK